MSKKAKKVKVQINVKIDPDDKQKLKDLAKQYQREYSDFVRLKIKEIITKETNK